MTTTAGPVAARPPGRPRSERAEKAIIEATLALVAEGAGLADVSIEAVAARAGVGKTTIYRRWPNKEALIVDALAAIKEPLPELAGESVRDDLVAFALAFSVEKSNRRQDCYWNVIGGAEKHPELMRRYTRDVIEPRREVIRGVLRRGIASGELRPDIDIDVALAAIVGAISMRAREVAPIPPDFAVRVVDTLLLGLAPE